jgi:hypothetical protein
MSRRESYGNKQRRKDITLLIPMLKEQRLVMDNDAFSEKYAHEIDEMILRHSSPCKRVPGELWRHPNPIINIFTIQEIHWAKKNYANFYNIDVANITLRQLGNSSAGFMGWLNCSISKSNL